MSEPVEYLGPIYNKIVDVLERTPGGVTLEELGAMVSDTKGEDLYELVRDLKAEGWIRAEYSVLGQNRERPVVFRRTGKPW